jgi:hypothetical protein
MSEAMSKTDFIPGLELSERFYREAIKPVLDSKFPSTLYSAALIGDGSEVLGFDTAMSTDHDWGPRAQIFLKPEDHRRWSGDIGDALSTDLPREFHGYPTSFTPPDENDNGTQLLDASGGDGPINHRVEILTAEIFFAEHLGFALDSSTEIAAEDWLTFPQQKLATITGGRVFHDQIGLEAVRARFSYYPHDIWLYLLASGWNRIEQEEHLMGRAGYVGDEIGSALIAARLVRDIMRLCFLMEKQYAPYQKWLGTAFAKLNAAEKLQPILRNVLVAEIWMDRQTHLASAYENVAQLHNRLGITPPLPTTAKDFFGRPFKVISMGQFSSALKAEIRDAAVKKIASKRLIGGIDQYTDSTDLVEDKSLRPTLRNLYTG